MRKIFFLAGLAVLAAATAGFAQVTGITLSNSSTASFLPFDINKQVLKIDITASSPDTLTSIEVTNSIGSGGADQPADIARVTLWYQPAGGAFNPAAAVFGGVLNKAASKDWSISGLSLPVAGGGSLYIAVDIAGTCGDNMNMRFRIGYHSVVFSSGGSYPSSSATNSSTQSTDNGGYLFISFIDTMPARAEKGQVYVPAMRIGFRNSNPSGGSTISVGSIRFQSVNYAGGVTMNAALSRIRVINTASGSSYVNYTSIPTSTTANVAMSTNISVPAGGALMTVDVYVDLTASINTYDIGLRIPQVTDINHADFAYPGAMFPEASPRAQIMTPVSSLNVSHLTRMPGFVTKGQNDIPPFVLRFTHPQSVTTYSDCGIRGITVTALSNPALNANLLFDRVRATDGTTVFYDKISGFSTGSNTVYLPFSSTVTVSPGTYKDITILADVLPGITASSFYMSLSKTPDIWAVSGCTGVTITPVMASSLTSTSAVIQAPPSYAGAHHQNRMPSSANKGQAFVYAEDITFTHPDPAGAAPIQIAGITLNAEDSVGNNIIPSSVISKITVLDALNNTLLAFSAIPSSGSQLYLSFPSGPVIQPGTSAAIKLYVNIAPLPSQNSLKLDLQSPSGINAVDQNSFQPAAVQPDLGDSFAMKTSGLLITDPAAGIKAYHGDRMPPKVNMGQQSVIPMTLNLTNDQGGIAAVNRLRINLLDAGGAGTAASGVINNVRIDNSANTAIVYSDTGVTTSASVLDIALAQPVILSSPCSVTINVKVNIASPAAGAGFRTAVYAGASVTEVDFNTGLTIPAAAYNDTFPMQSSYASIEARAQTLNAAHLPVLSGTVTKGDVNQEVMDLIFTSPVSPACDIMVTGLTLTVENAAGTINAFTALSRMTLIDKNTLALYSLMNGMPLSEQLYFEFSQPAVIHAGGPQNITISVLADIATFASAASFRLNLKNASCVKAFDNNQALPVSVTARAGDSFPDMRSNAVNIASSTRLGVLHRDMMPPYVTNGQAGIEPFSFRIGNGSAGNARINSFILKVRDQNGLPAVPAQFISRLLVVEDGGTTNAVISSIPAAGDQVSVSLSTPVDIPQSSFTNMSIYVDIADNTFTAGFYMMLVDGASFNVTPPVLTVMPDTGDSFPMQSSMAVIQIKPVKGEISHNDVMPTTVSTGQSDIFAEILNLGDYNLPGSADIMLAGITMTVEDDTNTVIDPTRALKKITIKDDSGEYCSFTGFPAAAVSFYMPFSRPVYLSASSTASVRVYADIADTLQAGTMLININAGSDLSFRDRNTGASITAVAVNGDKFPMKTSPVIIQQKAALCRAAYLDMMPGSVNKGQGNVTAVRLSLSNEGGASGANIVVTKINLNIEDASNFGLIPASVISRVEVRGVSGAFYGELNSMPNSGDVVSVGLTTPITIAVGEKKEVYVICDIAAGAAAAGFRVNVKYPTSLLCRDANSYSIINASAWSGFSFPMRSGYAVIQNKSSSLTAGYSPVMPPAVNKGDAGRPALYLEFQNLNPAQYSSVLVKGLTVTVEDNNGAGINPATVLSAVWAGNPGVIGAAASAGPGAKIYIPFSTPLEVPPGTPAGLTVYADISASASGLFVQIGLDSAADIFSVDKNSGSVVAGVSPEPGSSFPMRSGSAVIQSTPGIRVSHAALLPAAITTGQAGVPAFDLTLENVGSYAEQVSEITITVKDQYGGIMDSALIAGNAVVIDDAGNTIGTDSTPAGPKILLKFSPPFSINPQSTENVRVYADSITATYTAAFRLSIASASDISATAAVSAGAGDSFPMQSGLCAMQVRQTGLAVSMTDYMPPSASSGQPDVFVMSFTVSNTGSEGSSTALLTGITLTVTDSMSNSVDANGVIGKLTVTDLDTEYLSGLDIAASPVLSFAFGQPVTLAAGESKEIYIIVDVSSLTPNAGANFKLSLASASGLVACDYNDTDSPASVQAGAGFSFPMESGVCYLQKKAQQLKVSHADSMPASVSAGQNDVRVFKLVFFDQGDTGTASVMLTRINLYTQDSLNNSINAAGVIKSLEITNSDGTALLGSCASFAGSKAVINLTTPAIIPAAVPVTLCVRAGIASPYLDNNFRISLNSGADIYSVDANSFSPVPAQNLLPDTFPMRSGAAVIQDAALSAGLDSFMPLLSAGVTRGQKRAPLFAFKISDNMGPLAAPELFRGLTVTVRSGSGGEVSANTCIEKLYVIDGDSHTLAAAFTGIGKEITAFLPLPVTLSPASCVYVTVFADIMSSASAPSFRVSLESVQDISIIDANSGYEAAKNFTPLPAWNAGPASVYDAPAFDLLAWHDGSMVPTLIGKGQTNVRFMSISFYNPGGTGTSSVMVEGISLTAVDGGGNVIPPAGVLASLKLCDVTGVSTYGYCTASAVTGNVPAYITMDQPMEVPALNTRTVYAVADISAMAANGCFKLSVATQADICRHNNPAGSVTLTAANGDSFSFDSGLTTITAVTYSLAVGHVNLMPVSAAKGQNGVRALRINFENLNAVPVAVTSAAISIKSAAGGLIAADSVIAAMTIRDASGNVIAQSAAGGSGVLLMPLSSFTVMNGGDNYFDVYVDLTQGVTGHFYVELCSAADISSSPVSYFSPKSGDFFGNLRSTALSVQADTLEQSYHVYPNPFDPSAGRASIEYYLAEDSAVTIGIYTVNGRLVKKVTDAEQKTAGLHSEDAWDGNNKNGREAASGVYIYVIETKGAALGNKKLIKKMTLLR